MTVSAVTFSNNMDSQKSTLTIDSNDIVGDSYTFFGRIRNETNNNTGNLKLIATSDSYTSTTFLNFNQWGEIGKDLYDAYKLLPLQPSENLTIMSYIDNDGIDINTLPFSHYSSKELDFDVMHLDLNENYEYITIAKEVTLNWELDNLPEHISVQLTDLLNDISIDLSTVSEYTFLTEEKGGFLSYSQYDPSLDIAHTLFNRDEQFPYYPRVGLSRFLITVNYGSISGDINEDGLLNILDVVEIIALTLINEYNENADFNGDMVVNVLDVVMIVDSILTN